MDSAAIMRATSDMRTLTLVSTGSGLPDWEEIKRREIADQMPRVSTFRETLNSDILDERFLSTVPPARSRAYALLPLSAAQILEGFALRNNYDAVISWTEHLGLPLAALFKATGRRPVHVSLFSWISKPKKALLLKGVHSHIDRIILWSSVQRDFAIEALGIPPWKIGYTRHYVDQKFWRPMGVPDRGMICAAGREMRDYGTLIEALRGLSTPCHIAAKPYPGKNDNWIGLMSRKETLPPNVSMGPKNPPALRDLYAGSRFVVIPLLPTDTDNGVTCILESMAMGKAVICSRVQGQRDVIQEGKTGLFVPAQNPRALREAIEHLWANPAEAERIGRAGREYVEKYHTLEFWLSDVRAIVEDAIRSRRSARQPQESGREIDLRYT